MDLDQLQSVRDRERQTDRLQELRESFYEDAAAFVRDLRAERDEAAAATDDPFEDPRVNRLTDRIRTAEQTLEAIYEKRVGKVVKAATFAAADLPAEAEGMTREEADLFETLVAEIEANRERVLGRLSDESDDDTFASTSSDATADDAGEATASSNVPANADPTGSAAGDEREPPIDEGGGGSPGGAPTPAGADEEAEPSPASGDDEGDGRSGASGGSDGGEPAGADDPETAGGPGEPDTDTGTDGPDTEAGTDGPDADAEVERTLVRITDDVGPILGVDEREYDLATDDVVTLPAENARPLVERGAAERLD